MNLQKLNPWNWFKHEEQSGGIANTIPVKHSEYDGRWPSTAQPASHPFFQLHREIDRMFDETFHRFGFPSLGNRSSLLPRGSATGESFPFHPSINVSGDNENYFVSLDVPGLTESDLSIEVKNDILTIQGEKQDCSENEEYQFYRIERRHGAFQRILSLPEDANADDIHAKINNGVLQLTIPRKETVKSEVRKIAINH